MLKENSKYKIYNSKILNFTFERKLLKKGEQIELEISINSSYSHVDNKTEDKYISNITVDVVGEEKLKIHLECRNNISNLDSSSDFEQLINNECIPFIYNSLKEKLKEVTKSFGMTPLVLPDLILAEACTTDEE